MRAAPVPGADRLVLPMPLADLGADVIKVESPDGDDSLRFSNWHTDKSACYRMLNHSQNGFGQTCPLMNGHAHNLIAQALSRLRPITAWPGGKENRIVISTCDDAPELHGALAVLPKAMIAKRIPAGNVELSNR